MKGRAFNTQTYQAEQARKVDQKKSGGWFSCFSSTAIENNAPNMMTQQQADRQEKMRQMQEYNYQMEQQQKQFQPQLQSRQNAPQLVRRNTSVADLDALRSESKLRLQQNVPYRPQNSQFDGSTQSGSIQKDLGFYTGGTTNRSKSVFGRSASQSNMKVDPRVGAYNTAKKNQHLNQSMTNGFDGQYTKLAYQGKARDYTPNKTRSKSPSIQPKALPNRFQPPQARGNEFEHVVGSQFPSFRDKDSFYGDANPEPIRRLPKPKQQKIKLQEYPPERVVKPVKQNYLPAQVQQQQQFQYPQQQFPPAQNLNRSRAEIENEVEMQRQQQLMQPRVKSPPKKAKTFWTHQVISNSMNLAQSYRTNALNIMIKNAQGRMNMMDEPSLIEARYTGIMQRYQKQAYQMYQDLDVEYENSQRYQDAGAEIMTQQQYEDARQEVHWDIAWQIFDETNEFNDTEQHIDLNCLEVDDAIAITKQKIYDLAAIAQKEFPRRNHVLNIMCSEQMMVKMVDRNSRKSVLKNVIHDMIQNELGLDNHYIAQQKATILVKVDAETMNNPILMEW